jgi:hypothetical protein
LTDQAFRHDHPQRIFRDPLRESSSPDLCKALAKADDPVRRGLSALSLTLVEYWIARSSLSSGGA